MKNKISPNEIIQLLSFVVADKNYSKLQKFDQIEEIIDGYYTLKDKKCSQAAPLADSVRST